jgi:cysteine desulfurase
MKEIYMDCGSTTSVYSEVAEEMKKVFLEEYGNPSSTHEKGEKAFKLISDVRKKIAREIGCKSYEIIFTSGGTEGNNLALKGVGKKKIFVSEVEHPSVFEVAHFLKRDCEIFKIPVDEKGFVSLDFIDKNVDGNSLVSVMHVNNIFGTINNLRDIGRICKKKKAVFHSDCVQSFGKLKIDVNDWGIDLLTGSGHKIGGPKGIGFLYVKNGIRIEPIIQGGGQEKGIRSGTENVGGIVGFGKALEILEKVDWKKVSEKRDKIIFELEKLGGKINGALSKNRIYGNVHVSFLGKNSDKIILKLSERGIYISSGSACENKKKKDERVLRGIGMGKKEIEGSLRISIDEKINEEDVNLFIKELKKLL